MPQAGRRHFSRVNGSGKDAKRNAVFDLEKGMGNIFCAHDATLLEVRHGI